MLLVAISMTSPSGATHDQGHVEVVQVKLEVVGALTIDMVSRTSGGVDDDAHGDPGLVVVILYVIGPPALLGWWHDIALVGAVLVID